MPDTTPAVHPVNPIGPVADNDLAFGKFVETISDSKYWKDSAIFAADYDTQEGADHTATPWPHRQRRQLGNPVKNDVRAFPGG